MVTASLPYQEIVQRLEKLEPAEIWLLFAEVQKRIRVQPKRSLSEFAPDDQRAPGLSLDTLRVERF